MSQVTSETLNEIAKNSLYGLGMSGEAVKYSYNLFNRFMRRGETVLELGPAEGIGTKILLDYGYDVTVVDGAESFCEILQHRHKNLKVICSMFETMQLEQIFDNIILGHVLEHVSNPVKVLKYVSKFLNKGGRFFAAVPNAMSLHRQAAVIMGLLPSESSFSDLDRHNGHQRVYTPESFRSDFINAGLNIEVYGGYWLKPISNNQIEGVWTEEMIKTFFQLGERYPDIAAEIYIVASRQ
jgi:2-polyprenyl-3-methyl-5-hydroxy-6-metoxy-1,4-benzoquinol methylase